MSTDRMLKSSGLFFVVASINTKDLFKRRCQTHTCKASLDRHRRSTLREA